jgi:FecR-like protein
MTDDGDRLDPQLLARYEVPEPAPDLADRFVARLGEREPPRRRPWVLVAAAGALAAAVALFVLWPAGRRTSTGTLAAQTQRTTVELGGRGVAVAEAGARLRWQVAGDARVDQDAGDVFYRVEHGGAFVVATPAGEVTVTGTCFRVELALVVTVTVYEGSVEVANAHGRVTLHAGEHATATRDTAPARSQVTGVEARLAEDHARITALEAKLAQLSGSDTPAAMIGAVQPTRRPFDMTQAELAKLAAECRLPFDVPPTAGSSLMEKIVEDGMKQADFSDSERAAVKRLIREIQPLYTNELVKFYTDITGADGSDLDPATIVLEIEQKSPSAEIAAAYRKLAAERAGQPVVAGDTVIEQYLRFAMRASDDFERKLAAEIGPARARAFRRTWGLVDWATDCPQKDHP